MDRRVARGVAARESFRAAARRDVAPYYAKVLGQTYQFPAAGVPWLLEKAFGVRISARQKGWPRMTYHPLDTAEEGYGTNRDLREALLARATTARHRGAVAGPKLICEAVGRRAIVKNITIDISAKLTCVPHRFAKGEPCGVRAVAV